MSIRKVDRASEPADVAEPRGTLLFLADVRVHLLITFSFPEKSRLFWNESSPELSRFTGVSIELAIVASPCSASFFFRFRPGDASHDTLRPHGDTAGPAGARVGKSHT